MLRMLCSPVSWVSEAFLCALAWLLWKHRVNVLRNAHLHVLQVQ